MTFLEAAIEVLRHESEPLHFSEIAKRAVERQLLSHVGRDPEAAMRTCLNSAVRGENSILVRNKPGHYALRPDAELPPEPVATPAQIAELVAAIASDPEVTATEAEAEATTEVGDAADGADDSDDAREADRSEGRRKRRRGRFGVRGEAPAPQLVAVKPTRRGVDPVRRTEVLPKVLPLEFEAPRGAGLDGVTDVALVMANAMSRLAEERPELRGEFESLQRGTSTSSGPGPTPGPTPAPELRRSRPMPGFRVASGAAAAPGSGPGAGSGAGPVGLGDDGDDRGGRRRRRRRRRGRRTEWGGEGQSDARSAEAQGLLAQVEAMLADAGPRSLHIRQIAETLANQNVLGGEISEIERVVTAALLLDIHERGRASRFVARGDARYQLHSARLPTAAATAETALRTAMAALEVETSTQLVQWVQSLGPRSLDALARIYLEREGFGLVASLAPVRGIGKLVVTDPEGEDEDARLLVLMISRKTATDPSAWDGDLERHGCTGYLVFAAGDPPDLEARTIGAGEFARWLLAQRLGVTSVPLTVTVLDPTFIESVGGLDT